jgi:hypothetical protein
MLMETVDTVNTGKVKVMTVIGVTMVVQCLVNNICQKELKTIYLRLKHYTIHYYNYQTLYNHCYTNHSHNLMLQLTKKQHNHGFLAVNLKSSRSPPCICQPLRSICVANMLRLS